jgi:hypothetical protein
MAVGSRRSTSSDTIPRTGLPALSGTCSRGLQAGEVAAVVAVEAQIERAVHSDKSATAEMSVAARPCTEGRRGGVTRDGAAARMFDATSGEADLRDFAERTRDDRHDFRFIVSPEDAAEMKDLRALPATWSSKWSTTSGRGWIGSLSITVTPTNPHIQSHRARR